MLTRQFLLLGLIYQSTSSATRSELHRRLDEHLHFDDSTCQPEHMVDKAYQDALQVATLAADGSNNMQNDTAFWEFFGPGAVVNLTDIETTFQNLVNSPLNISVTCNFDDKVPACTDWYRYGGIAGYQPSDSTTLPSLIFCREFFSFPPLDYRVNMGINHPTTWTARFDIGYYHENQGKICTITPTKLKG